MNAATWAAVAAVAAAVISAANIYVTTHSADTRERIKWFREELAHAYYIFIDASFHYRHEIGLKRYALADGASIEELELIEKRAYDRHSALRDAQTKIRVLAPRNVLEAAQKLRDELDILNKGLTSETTLAEFERRVARTRELREEFITLAKKSLKLRA